MIDITARRYSELLLYATLACLCDRAFECRVQELIEGGASTSGLSYGDPSILGSAFIHDLHPASWYAIPTTKGILLHLKEHNLTSFALSLSLFHAILSEPAKIGWNL